MRGSFRTETSTAAGGGAAPRPAGLARATRAALILVVVGLVLPVPAQSQQQGVALTVQVLAPAFVTVGDQNVAGTLRITNSSFGDPVEDENVELASLVFHPNCDTGAIPCPGAEPGTFHLDDGVSGPTPMPAPVGVNDPVNGTACAGKTFTVGAPAPDGSVVLTPNTPIILGPVTGPVPPTRCIVTYTFDVLTRPVDGNSRQVLMAEGQSQITMTTGEGLASSQVTINRALATLTTEATQTSGQLGASTFDEAFLDHTVPNTSPTGTVSFVLVGPNPDGTCSAPDAFSSPNRSVTPGAPGAQSTAQSAPTVPTLAGTYNWVATYSGDGNFEPITARTGCGDLEEIVSFAPPQPEMTVIKDAVPTERNEPGGTFTFPIRVINTGPIPVTITNIEDDVYGQIDLSPPAMTGPGYVPGSTTCDVLLGTLLAANGGQATCQFQGTFFGPAGATQTDVVTVGASGGGFDITRTDDATVRIVDVVGAIEVQKDASPLSRPEPGGNFTFVVTVTNPSLTDDLLLDTLTDNVYGNIANPANPNPRFVSTTCSLPQTIPAGGMNTYSCQFVGTFTGDPGDFEIDTVTASGLDEGVVPNRVSDTDTARVDITATPSSIQVAKTANPLSRPEPGGLFTFSVTVTNTSAVDTVFIDSLTDDVYGDITVVAGDITATTCDVSPAVALAPGQSYNCAFTVTFTGTPRSQTDIVTASGVDDDGDPVSESDEATIQITDLPSSIRVTKTASPLSLPEPGGNFTFSVTVTNTSAADTVFINSLTDDIYGDITVPLDPADPDPDPVSTTCDVDPAVVLAPGASYNCSFVAPFTGGGGDIQTDVVTASGLDDDGVPVEGSDDATVTIRDLIPTIEVDKTASPLSRPAPGGSFNFAVVVRNTSSEPLTLTTLTDNIYGDITAPLDPADPDPDPTATTCSVPQALAAAGQPGDTYTCNFDAPFTGPNGSSQTDIVTATAVDDEDNTATDSDSATVFITAAPVIFVDKTAEPTSLPEPGGTFTFRVRVANASAEALTITALDDDIYGDIADAANPAIVSTTCSVPQPLAASGSIGDTYTCEFEADFTGDAGDLQTDVVTARAVNAAGTEATDSDDATVRLTNIPSSLRVVKTANPLTRVQPGGTFTFTVVITNTSAVDSVTIDSITDDVYGNVVVIPGNTCAPLIDTVLLPGESTAPCSFDGNFSGAPGDTQTDTVTVTGTDSDGDPVEASDEATVGITSVTPQIVVTKSADPESRPEPGGDFTYTVEVFNNGPVALTIDSITDDVYGNLATRPGSTCGARIDLVLAPAASTSCTFTGTFTGNAGDSETDVVTVVATDPNGVEVTDSDDATVFITGVASSIQVIKDASPASRPEPGGQFTFTVTIQNTSAADSIMITAIDDDIYGDVALLPAPVGGTACSTLIGDTLPPGGSATCAFVATFTGAGGDSQTDVVTVDAIDDDGQTIRDSDDATVTITNLAPTMTVTKTASPLTRPEPGGEFTFTVRVSNTSSVDPLLITSITDDVYGNLNGRGTCAIGVTIQPGGVYTCSFTGTFFGDAGDSQVDVVTVSAIDDDGSTITDSDDAVVRLTDVPPTVVVTKTADPLSRPEPGGVFTFTVVVRNASAETVTVTSLVDDVYGNLNGRGTCAVGAVIPAGGTYTCAFPVLYLGDAGDTETDVVTVTVIDNDGTTATDSDDATITLFDVPPSILVTKTANPTSVNEPGGLVTFTVVVRNTSFEIVRLVSLFDDTFGNLNGRGSCVIGGFIAPNATYTCTFTGNVTGVQGANHTNEVTATAVDNEGSIAIDRDVAVVVITGPVISPISTTTVAGATPPASRPPLVLTGSDTGGPLQLAAVLVAAGALLLVAVGRADAAAELRLAGPSWLRLGGLRGRRTRGGGRPAAGPGGMGLGGGGGGLGGGTGQSGVNPFGPPPSRPSGG